MSIENLITELTVAIDELTVEIKELTAILQKQSAPAATPVEPAPAPKKVKAKAQPAPEPEPEPVAPAPEPEPVAPAPVYTIEELRSLGRRVMTVGKTAKLKELLESKNAAGISALDPSHYAEVGATMEGWLSE